MTNTMRHYYATVHTHDVRFRNDHGTLWRFVSKKERDEFVENHHCTETVTYKMARKLYPEVFRALEYRGTRR